MTTPTPLYEYVDRSLSHANESVCSDSETALQKVLNEAVYPVVLAAYSKMQDEISDRVDDLTAAHCIIDAYCDDVVAQLKDLERQRQEDFDCLDDFDVALLAIAVAVQEIQKHLHVQPKENG